MKNIAFKLDEETYWKIINIKQNLTWAQYLKEKVKENDRHKTQNNGM